MERSEAATGATPPTTDDLAAARARYREERVKRLRADGVEQYRLLDDELGHFADDPFVEPGYSRPAVADEVDAAVLGGGIGGILAGVQLRGAGLDRVRVVEKAGDFGGTWYWNRYPGAQCDIESYIYLPMLEETGYMPTERYSHQPEILAYLQSLARRYDLYRDALFQTAVTGLRWDAEAERWRLTTDRGDEIAARMVVITNGPLSRPKFPGVPGIEEFSGAMFHTSRWDFSYTGGDASGGLDGLRGKRVGVVGTGATAIQCVPHLAESAEHLYVFQRTPSTISERRNAPTDEGWYRSLPPGWQAERMRNFSSITSGATEPVDLVGDGWTEMFQALQSVPGASSGGSGAPTDLATELELLDLRRMEMLRARVDASVDDPNVAAALKPYYRLFCKRPCFHDEFLRTFTRDNVTLVDTNGRGIDAVTRTGVVVGESTIELDCLIFATGFEGGTSLVRQVAVDPVGRDGVRLSDRWRHGPVTLHGLQTHGFPNLFSLGITQTGVGANFVHMLERQVAHVAHIVRHCVRHGFTTVEATEEGERLWQDEMSRAATASDEYWAQCTPSRFNNEGNLAELGLRQAMQYGGGIEGFGAVLARWREADDFAGLRFTRAGSATTTAHDDPNR